jgi:hypothetical protein
LTFDEVMNFYLRKRREFLASGNEYKMRAPVEADESAKMRLHQQQYVLTECDMHSNPLLLFRMLFFVAMQDKRGEVHLLSAFQVHTIDKYATCQCWYMYASYLFNIHNIMSMWFAMRS